MKRCLHFIRTWSVPIVVAISVLCIFRFVLILGYVPSGSMEPTLKTGSFVVGLRIHPEPKVGEPRTDNIFNFSASAAGLIFLSERIGVCDAAVTTVTITEPACATIFLRRELLTHDELSKTLSG